MAKNQTTDEDQDSTKPAGGKPATAAKGPVPVHIGGESILDRLLPHVKKIALAVALIAVILLAVFGYRWWKDSQRGKATVHVAKGMEVLQTEVKAPDPTATPDPTKKPEPSFPTYQSRAAAALAELGKAEEGVSETFRAALLLDAGKLDEAEAAYRRASTRTDLEGILAREGLGFVAEARAHAATDPAQQQKFLEAALAAFRAVQPDDKGAHRDHALYHEGRMLDLLQKKPEAIAALEKALEVAPETELESEITQRIAKIEGEAQ